MFRILCDPSSGSTELCLTEITCSDSQIFCRVLKHTTFSNSNIFKFTTVLSYMYVACRVNRIKCLHMGTIAGHNKNFPVPPKESVHSKCKDS